PRRLDEARQHRLGPAAVGVAEQSHGPVRRPRAALDDLEERGDLRPLTEGLFILSQTRWQQETYPMSFFTRGMQNLRAAGRRRSTQSPQFQPRLEGLEDRTLFAINVRGGVPTWTEQGPGPIRFGQAEGRGTNPVVGPVQALAAHPTNADILFA